VEIMILEARNFGPFIFDITAKSKAMRRQKRIWAYAEVLKILGPNFISEPVEPEFKMPSCTFDPKNSEQDVDEVLAKHKSRFEALYQRALERYEKELEIFNRGMSLLERVKTEGAPTALADAEDGLVVESFYRMMLDGFFTETDEHVHTWESASD